MLRHIGKPVAAIFATMSLIVMATVPALAQFEEEYDPGTDLFERTWNRTDLPVAEGEVERTWIWGPGRTQVMTEPYAEAPGGERQVQYFDKARMEDHSWRTTTPPWDVTNGLLVVEMIEGWYQIGDNEFDLSPAPADIQIAGDPGQINAPTYRDIHDYNLRDVPADEVGTVITRTWTSDDEVGDNPDLAQYNVIAAERLTVPGIDHTVASPFWEFMTSSTTVYVDGEYVVDELFLNPYYATGYPLTEAYWSQVPVLGEEQWVLWQCFERRCLTYTPTNPEGFQVEAGNVGQHYWLFRYGEPQPPPPPDDYDGEYYVELNALNESGVYGAATLELEGNQLTVMLHATGLTPDEMHMQHIHGPEGGEATCPDLSYDENDDGLVDIGEGAPAYGPVVIPLFEDEGAETYPSADAIGEVRYTHTFTLSDEQLANLGNPLDRVIVLHGLELDGEYDGTVPVACGEIVEMPEDQNLQYYVNLDSLNESGVTGSAQLTLNGPWLTVSLETTGNEPEQTHMQHIHGLADENSTCPDPSYDTDDDGIVSVGEGAPAYGPMLLPLTPYPPANGEGVVSYEQQILVNLSRLGDLTERTVVTHGMVNPNTDEYDPSIPVACGEIQEGEAPPSPPPPEEQEYMVLFGELNNSGVSGSGTLTLVGGELTVDLTISGYVPDMVHMQHIHGLDDGAAVCPGPDADGDDDGALVSLEEGAAYYGGVVLALTNEDDEYPSADGEGNVSFSRTFEVDETLGDLTSRVIVLHGMDVGDYDETIPAACGLIVPADAETYIADDLSGDNVPPPNGPTDSEGEGEAWFWYDADGETIYYMLSVRNLEAITAAHIHGPAGAGEGAGVIVGLFTPDEGEYDAFGILSTGRITADDLGGDLADGTLADLVALFGDSDETSDAYVNVHTSAYPSGEIRDQVTNLAVAM